MYQNLNKFKKSHANFVFFSSPDCGANITNQSNGIITTPNYPNSYIPNRQLCNWYINVRPKHKVLLIFDVFIVEGEPKCKVF